MDNKTQTVVVFTFKDLDTILKFNGSSSWKLNRKRAINCKYIIVTKNSMHPLSNNSTNHGMAFMVGKVSNIIKAFEKRDDTRWLIEFDEYAEISIPNFWTGNRNPVIYKNTDELGINFEELDFKPIPPRDMDFIKKHEEETNKFFLKDEINISEEIIAPKVKEGISIADAKKQLSIFYDIEEDNIEIILKG